MAKSLLDKLWEAHLVTEETEDAPAVMYIDLHLVHEVTSPQAFAQLEERGLTVRRPDLTVATIDHSTPTLPADENGVRPYITEAARKQVEQLELNCKNHGITLHGWDSERRGIVHVIGPEMGVTQPGKTIVCGDSHTSTHGAFGALAFGIGTSEVAHVLATQCILQRKPKSMAVEVTGKLKKGVGAKDVALAIIAKIGVGGGTGYVIEYRGNVVRDMSMEERLTLCNMSIEAGARAGMVSPDQRTLDYLKGRPFAPNEEQWEKESSRWLSFATEEGASFDKVVTIDGSRIEPMVSYGTHPGMSMGISQRIPSDIQSDEEFKSLEYMGFKIGDEINQRSVDHVFIGSCTNSRLSDLRDAASIVKGRKVAKGVRMLVVPGSVEIKRLAEEEGLDQIFKNAGAQWREAGCSMCIAMNGDSAGEGETVVSTSNRNFMGRQGKGSRTILASPMTAAASAIAGYVHDPRTMMEEN